MTLERTVMREQIKELIIQRILEGTYKPGERIVELQLVHELGVSQAPVREAPLPATPPSPAGRSRTSNRGPPRCRQ